MTKLTDEHLADISARLEDPKCHDCGGRGERSFMRGVIPCVVCDGTGYFSLSIDTMKLLIAEVRACRARSAPHEPPEPPTEPPTKPACKFCGRSVGFGHTMCGPCSDVP